MRNTALALAGALSLAAAPLAATSFVMVPDDALVDRAPVAVEASILSRDAAPAAGTPATDYLIEVERVLKGEVPGSHLIVRVPGGTGPDGVGLKIWGAPAFAVGERVVLFLRPGDDGAFRVSQLMLGAFHEVEAGGEKILVRDLAEVDEVPMPGAAGAGGAEYRLPRRRDAFVEWIGERARGIEKAADYFYRAPPGTAPPRAITEPFTVFCDNPLTPGRDPVGGNGECPAGSFPLRWFEFGNGATVRWRIYEEGQPGLTPSQTLGALVQGMAAWTDEDGSDIRYGLDSPVTTDSTNGLSVHDDLNVLLLDDPLGIIGEPFNCATGGILAIGGPWFNTLALGSFGGKQYMTILNGDIITNRNLGCFFQSSPDPQRLAAQLFAHELGHTLGFGHSCETFFACAANPDADAAIMRAFIHDTAHGPDLRSDDVAAARHHYGTSAGEAPAAPSGLVATPVSATTILLDWQDESTGESGFVIEVSSPVEPFQEVATAAPNVTAFAVGGLTTGRPYTFRVRAASGPLLSAPSNEASATPQADGTAACAADADTLCLLDERFRVEVQWRDQINGGNGIGLVQPSPVGGTRTGVFSFFNPNNIELIVKALDGNPVNGHYWLFYGALSTVEYWVTVTDTATGDSNTYHNPPGELCGVPDTEAFPASAPAAAPRSAAAPPVALPAAGASGTCEPSPTTLCLTDGRFEVSVDWLDQRTLDDGIGIAVPGSDRTGYFWFFNAENVELVVKILDATSISGNWWVFYGALSDVQYTISVRDTLTGFEHAYQNAPGNFCGQADTGRFPDGG